MNIEPETVAGLYNSNINSWRFKSFHKTYIQNFNISLSDILNSDLFQVEENNGMYKICPLFYCNEIQSNKSHDVIKGTSCILTYADDVENYYTFLINDDEIVNYNEDYTNFFSYGDEFSSIPKNDFVYIISKNFKEYYNIDLRHTTYYDELWFNFDNEIYYDNGIRFNDRHIGTVRLQGWGRNTNFCTVNLILKYYEFTSPNVDAENISDYEIKTYKVSISENETSITIPNFSKGIVLFDAVLEVVHDKPEIRWF